MTDENTPTISVALWLAWRGVRYERTVTDRSWFFGIGKVTVNR